MRLYGKQKPATREPSTKAVRMAARVWSSPDVEVRFIDEAHGHGMFALRQLSAGTRLFQEYPLVAIRHQKNRKVGPSCEHCFRFLGPIEAQMRALLEKRAAKCEAIPPACEDASLPSLPALRELPLPVPCPGGCEITFCSERCAMANLKEYHCLLCKGRSPTTAAASSSGKRRARDAPVEELELGSMGFGSGASGKSGASGSSGHAAQAATISGGGSTGRVGAPGNTDLGYEDDDDDTGGDGGAIANNGGAITDDGSVDMSMEAQLGMAACRTPLTRFEAHARATNEIFLLAAKSCAKIVLQMRSGIPFDVTMEPYPGLPHPNPPGDCPLTPPWGLPPHIAPPPPPSPGPRH